MSQLRSFILIGVASTLAYATLYNAARGATTPSLANLFALAVTAVLNTVANRRFTFGIRGSAGALHDQLGGMVALAVALGTTNGALVVLHGFAPAAPRTVEIAALVAANLVATLVRFALLRAWIALGALPLQPRGQDDAARHDEGRDLRRDGDARRRHAHRDRDRGSDVDVRGLRDDATGGAVPRRQRH